MAKLQRIKRSNGSASYSVNIPKEIIEKLGWEKGIELFIESFKHDNGKKIILISDDLKIIPAGLINQGDEKKDG